MKIKDFFYNEKAMAMTISVDQYRDVKSWLQNIYSGEQIARIDDFCRHKSPQEKFLLCNQAEMSANFTPVMYVGAVTFVDRVPFEDIAFNEEPYTKPISCPNCKTDQYVYTVPSPKEEGKLVCCCNVCGRGEDFPAHYTGASAVAEWNARTLIAVMIRVHRGSMSNRHGTDFAVICDDPKNPQYASEEQAKKALKFALGYVDNTAPDAEYPGYREDDEDLGCYFDYLGYYDTMIPDSIVQRIRNSVKEI